MAISSPNYTQVPNEVLDVMDEMSEVAFRVTICITRQTKGYQKEKDRLTVTRIADLTGLSRQGVYDGITEARDTWHFIKQEDCPQIGHVYSLDIAPEPEIPPKKKVSTERTQSVNSNDTQKKERKNTEREIEISPTEMPQAGKDCWQAFQSTMEKAGDTYVHRFYLPFVKQWYARPEPKVFMTVLAAMVESKHYDGFRFLREVRSYNENPKPVYPPRREQFQRPNAPAPPPYRKKTPEEIAAFRAALARGSP